MQMNAVIVSLTAARKGDRGPERTEARRKQRQRTEWERENARHQVKKMGKSEKRFIF